MLTGIIIIYIHTPVVVKIAQLSTITVSMSKPIIDLTQSLVFMIIHPYPHSLLLYHIYMQYNCYVNSKNINFTYELCLIVSQNSTKMSGKKHFVHCSFMKITFDCSNAPKYINATLSNIL
jgi:hypothetical protein